MGSDDPAATGPAPRSSGDGGGVGQQAKAGRSPVLDPAQLEVLSRYGTEHQTAAGDLLFADGDETYDLIVLLAGEAEIIERCGQPGEWVIAAFGQSQFLGEIGLLTGQRAYLSAVASTAGRVLSVPVARLRVIMAQEPSLSELILRAFLLRHSILTGLGPGLTLIGSRFDAGTRRLLEVLARNRLTSRWLQLESSPEAETMLRELNVPVTDLPIVVVPGGPLLRNPGRRGIRRVRRDGHDPGRGHRPGRPGGLIVPDREPAGPPGRPVRGATGGARGPAGPEVRRAHQAGIRGGVTVVGLRRAPGQLRRRRYGDGEAWLAGQLAEDNCGFLLTGTSIPRAQLDDTGQTPLYLEPADQGSSPSATSAADQ
jgi:CRP-like cAMP-binding protein